MSALPQSKIVIYLASIFLVGAISGAVVAWGAAKERRVDVNTRKHTTMRDVCDHLKKRYQSHLDLTPAQMEKVEPILDETWKQMRAIHGRTMQEIDEVLDRSNAEIARELTPQQQVKLVEMTRERQEFHRKRMGLPSR